MKSSPTLPLDLWSMSGWEIRLKQGPLPEVKAVQPRTEVPKDSHLPREKKSLPPQIRGPRNLRFLSYQNQIHNSSQISLVYKGSYINYGLGGGAG